MSGFDAKNIAVQKTARYHHRACSEETRAQWMIAHGYGMLTTYFARKFESLPNTNELLVPEGLHRFYVQGTEGRVGASWMTKEERENDIRDYIQYLNKLYSKHRKEAPLIAFGFSQGVATICRWAAQLTHKPAHLILWAGVIPPDMDPYAWENVYANVPITIFVGTHDPYRTDAHNTLYQHIKSVRKHVDIVEFDGAHAVDAQVLTEWYKRQRF